jgi:hypothetical protein
MTDLKDLLDHASDDEGRPLRTDLGDLVDRARGRRRQTRAARLTAVVLAGGLAASVVVAVAALQTGQGDGAGPAPTTSPPSSSASRNAEAPTLTAAQVVARCRPQLAAYASLPMYTQHPDRADWSLKPGRYLVGDLVLVDPNDGYNPEFCRVPATGHEHDRVPLASYTGSATDLDDLTQNCRQLGGSGFSGFTLRGAASGAITAADTVDGVSSAVLVTRGGDPALCTVEPVTWDAGISDVQPFGHGIVLADGTTGGGNKSIVDQTASWYLLGGSVSPQAATVELSVQGGPTASFRVHDTYVAGVLRDPRAGGLQPVTWRVLDDQGVVLSAGGAPLG